MGGAFHLFPIVEGYGEIEAVPKLLHKIWSSDKCALRVENPYRIPNGTFIHKAEKRRKCMNSVMHKCRPHLPHGGVLILIDADSPCCKNFLDGDKMKEINTDIKKIFGNDVLSFFALAEREYESWLVAGLGGGNEGAPKRWLKERFGQYSEVPDQKKLTSIPEFDIKRAYEINVSFRRFRERVLALPGKAA